MTVATLLRGERFEYLPKLGHEINNYTIILKQANVKDREIKWLVIF